jgi:hypothetical protein
VTNPPPSIRHEWWSPASPSWKVKVAVDEFVGLGGAESTVGAAGGTVSTVHAQTVAGPVVPWESVALTANECVASARPE